jgi:hypothetical protein
MFINNLRCRFSFDEPTAAQTCTADLSPVGMAVSTLRHYFGQPAKVCTSCTFDIVTNHPYQNNLTPSSDIFEVPMHRICSLSPSMFLSTKHLALLTFNNKISPPNLRQPVSKPSCDTILFWRVSFSTNVKHIILTSMFS